MIKFNESIKTTCNETSEYRVVINYNDASEDTNYLNMFCQLMHTQIIGKS